MFFPKHSEINIFVNPKYVVVGFLQGYFAHRLFVDGPERHPIFTRRLDMEGASGLGALAESAR